MKTRNLKEIKIVIMDDTNKGIVEYIKSMVNAWTLSNANGPVVYKLRNDHSMTVIKSRLYEDEIDVISKRIEERFPGLCMFNPPMAV